MLFNIKIYANELTFIPPEEDVNDYEFILKSNDESCKFILGEGSVYPGTCIKLINSQNHTIICTPKKTICKTKDESYDLADAYFKKDVHILKNYYAGDYSSSFKNKKEVPCSELGSGLPSKAICYSFPPITFGDNKSDVFGLFNDKKELISITLVSILENKNKDIYDSMIKGFSDKWKLLAITKDGIVTDMLKEKKNANKIKKNVIDQLIHTQNPSSYINFSFSETNENDYNSATTMKKIYNKKSTKKICDTFLVKSIVDNQELYILKYTFYSYPKSFSCMSRLNTKSDRVKPKKKEPILDVVDVMLDYQQILGNNVCVRGDISSYGGLIFLNDNSSNTLNLNISKLTRDHRKSILTDCGYSKSNECKNLIICGKVEEINFDKGLIVSQIKSD